MGNGENLLIVKNNFLKNESNLLVLIRAEINGKKLPICCLSPQKGEKEFKLKNNEAVLKSLYIWAIRKKDCRIQYCSLTLNLNLIENKKAFNNWPLILSIKRCGFDKPRTWVLEFPVSEELPEKVYINIDSDSRGDYSTRVKNTFSDAYSGYRVEVKKKGDCIPKDLVQKDSEKFINVGPEGIEYLNIHAIEYKDGPIADICPLALRLQMKKNIGITNCQFELSRLKDLNEWKINFPTHKNQFKFKPENVVDPPTNININVGDDIQ